MEGEGVEGQGMEGEGMEGEAMEGMQGGRESNHQTLETENPESL